MIHHQQAVDTLIEAFPELEAEIRDETWAGLIHLEVSCFASYTQRQIDSGNKSELKRCFEVAREFILKGDPDVVNAMHVSYLEHLNVMDQQTKRSWALEHMPQVLRDGLDAVSGNAGDG